MKPEFYTVLWRFRHFCFDIVYTWFPIIAFSNMTDGLPPGINTFFMLPQIAKKLTLCHLWLDRLKLPVFKHCPGVRQWKQEDNISDCTEFDVTVNEKSWIFCHLSPTLYCIFTLSDLIFLHLLNDWLTSQFLTCLRSVCFTCRGGTLEPHLNLSCGSN